MKRGLLELVDLIVVNKADGENLAAARRTANEYRDALRFFADNEAGESNAVFTCSALHRAGIDAVWEAICERITRMKSQGKFAERRRQQRLLWLWETVEERIRQSIARRLDEQNLRDELERRVLDDEMTVEAAAREMLEACGYQTS
jgi:LAO/AO transport system kinase